MKTTCTDAKDKEKLEHRVIIHKVWFINKEIRFHYNLCLCDLYNLASNSICDDNSLSNGLNSTTLIAYINDHFMYKITVHIRGQGWTLFYLRLHARYKRSIAIVPAFFAFLSYIHVLIN